MLYNHSTDIQFLKHFYDTTEMQGSSLSCACSYAYLKVNYSLSTPGRQGVPGGMCQTSGECSLC